MDCDDMREGQGDDVRLVTEGLSYPDIPSSAFGLLDGGRNTPSIVLDTKFGIVHWEECPSDLFRDSPVEHITEDFEDYTPVEEHDWRGNGVAWPIPDFFEMLKEC